MAEEEKSKDVGSDTDKEPPQSATTALLRTLGTKVLTGLLTVGGLATFAAFSGSIVLWTRFDALQLPAEQIIEVVPRGEALVAGAMILLLFGFCGAVAAFAVFLIDRAGRATPGMSRGVLLIVAAEALAAIWLAGDTAMLDKAIASEVLILALGCAIWATYAGGLVELRQGEVAPLFEGEKAQAVKPSAFRAVDKHGRQKSQVTPARVTITILVGFLLGALCGLAASLIADAAGAGEATEVGWACGLCVFGLALAAAVGLRLLEFDRSRKRSEKKAAKALRKQWEKDEQERREKKSEQRRAERRAHRFAKLTWLVSWWKLSLEGGKQKDPRLSLSFGAPEGAPDPPPEPQPEKEPESAPKSKPPRFRLTAYGKLAVTLLALVAVVVPAAILGQRWLAITMAVVIAIGLGLWRLAEFSKGDFIWYGLAVALSVPLFGTVALALRNIDDPQAQPVAIIRHGDGGTDALQGLFVTETKERVYFANIATEGCGKKVVGDSGRLFWIPKGEVAAMAIGPKQDVHTAARASLEMAYALTPDIETPEGGHVSLTPELDEGDRAAGEDDMSAGAKEVKGRLETAGPAVRHKFGVGLQLKPPQASPGGKVKLVLPTPEFGGLSDLREGSSLRLNGRKLKILDSRVAEEGEVEPEREWIEFRVPNDASSGIVEVECTQLAGQPYLTVPRRPAGRIAVRMQTDSRRVIFDSSNSSDDRDKGKELVRTWTVAGLRKGHGVSVGADLPPRLAPYKVRLEVSDSEGQTDVVDLRLLRLPQSRFPFGADRPASTRPVERVRRAVGHALNKLEPDDLASIQINGHADSVDTDAFNVRLSYRRAHWMRKQLFAPRFDGRSVAGGPALTNEDDAVALAIRAFGESCPIVRKQGPQEVNRRVEVFLLGKGASVATPKGCRAGRLLRTSW